jgi:hypothetical protein
MEPMEPTGTHAMVNSTSADAQTHELRARNDPMLAIRDCGDPSLPFAS